MEFELERNPEIASPPSPEVKWRQEIRDAKEGVKVRVSAKAAAFYLGVHYKTLEAWRKDGTGPTPTKNEAKRGTPAANQHVSYTLEALDAYQAIRQGDSIARASLTAAARDLAEAHRMDAAVLREQAKDKLVKARDRAKRAGVLAFGSIESLAEAHPWAQLPSGLLAGHWWTVDEPIHKQASPWVGTLSEALREPWTEEAARQPFAQSLLDVLNNTRAELDVRRAEQRQRDLDGLLGQADSDEPIRKQRL